MRLDFCQDQENQSLFKIIVRLLKSLHGIMYKNTIKYTPAGGDDENCVNVLRNQFYICIIDFYYVRLSLWSGT